MVNKRSSFASYEDKDYDPLDSYGYSDQPDHRSDPKSPKPDTATVAPAPAATSTATPDIFSRSSWEETVEPYPSDAFDYSQDYGDNDDDGDDDGDDDYDYSQQYSQVAAHVPSPRQASGEGDLDDEAATSPNPDLFKSSILGPRSSVCSAKSYSSNTKHHSFGYNGEQRPEPSDSESNSESESDQDQARSKNAPSVVVAASPNPVPADPSAPATSSKPLASSPPGSQSAPTADQSESLPRTVRGATPPTSKSADIQLNESVHASTTASSPPASPEPVSVPVPVPGIYASTSAHQTPADSPISSSLSSTASDSSIPKRLSGSESDTSNSSVSSVSICSPTLRSPLKSSQRPGLNQRTLSGASRTSRDIAQGRHYPDFHRTLDTNPRSAVHTPDLSDSELNDVALDESSSQDGTVQNRREGHSRKASGTVATPRAPVAASNAGFPSSFFGGRPHPKAQQFQQLQQPSSQPATPSQPQPATVILPESRPPMVRSGSSSISSIASTIQGAFLGRGFAPTTSPGLPPMPVQSSRVSTSHRGTPAGMVINTGVEFRSSGAISPGRASTYSTMTMDSNMDLLLARLDSKNSGADQDPTKNQESNDAEMDRAIGFAKEESASEDVDWDYWGALMHDYNAVAKKNPKQLTAMIQKGVPPALRGLIWQLLAKSKDPQLEATFAELLKSSSSHEKQIIRDMSRTFPNHEYFQNDGPGQEALFNVVKAYSLYDKEVGYCQGLSFVVGPLLLNMPEEEAFCILVRMMNTFEMRGHFTPEMNVLQLRLFQYEQLMEEIVPMVAKHFQNQGIKSTMYASQWFMTLFAYKFPLELVFRVYDILFVEGVESIFRFSIALLKANHDQILNHEFETLIEFLKNGLFEPYMEDAGLLIRDAYSVKVTPKKLQQYAQKYNALVQKQQAELAAEESLRESNRQLSMHVRRLEGSLHTLNKEHVDLARELISRKVEMAQLQDQNDVLTQKSCDLTKIVDSQAKEVEDRLRGEIDGVLARNVELVKKNELLEDQLAYLETQLIETKMKYAECENEKGGLARKLSDMRKALSAS
ncbi:GTPase-activating protein [Lunasporangiospora selenospora]|uniref:GTPase-activating protein n=1 Tax=Lunasporangiospora selenospora TaxID=979761 RepID=A0A9P6KBI2_9FUNG|nr:GTPase-activating protein [Lunasporangiospora selenospora]